MTVSTSKDCTWFELSSIDLPPLALPPDVVHPNFQTGGHRSRISNNSGTPSSSGGGGGGGGGGYPNSAAASAPGAAAGGAEVSAPLGDDDNTCIVSESGVRVCVGIDRATDENTSVSAARRRRRKTFYNGII